MRQVLCLLTFLAFAAQAWIPSGFMPVQGAPMAVCNGGLDHTVDHRDAGHTPLQKTGKCPYAAFLVYHDVQPVAAAPLPARYESLTASLTSSSGLRLLWLLSTRPRGPPALVS